MSGETMYRIDYSIKRQREGDDDFTEIGFGSSGGWHTIAGASHWTASALETYDWETEPGQPEPEEIKRDEEAAGDA